MFLLYFTGSTCSQNQENHTKHTPKNTYVFTTRSKWEKSQKPSNITSKMAPKMWGRNGGGRLGALLGHLWRPNPFFNTKSVAKVLQKWPQGCKSEPKVLQKWPQGRKIYSKRGAEVAKVHQTCHLQDTKARRTARSALNKTWLIARSSSSRQHVMLII